MVRPMLPPTRASVGPVMNQRARRSGSTRYCQTLSTGASSSRSKRSMAEVAWSVGGVSATGVLLAGFARLAGWAGRRRGVVLQRLLEGVEAGGPELLPLAQPVAGVLQPLGPDPAQMLAAHLAAVDQPGLRQHRDVLGGARKAHPVRRGQFADGFLAQHQVGQHPAAGGVGQCGKGTVEVLFNHGVECCGPLPGLSTIRLSVAGTRASACPLRASPASGANPCTAPSCDPPRRKRIRRGRCRRRAPRYHGASCRTLTRCSITTGEVGLSSFLHTYRYAQPSALRDGAVPRLSLETSSAPDGLQPHFFEGNIREPRLVAQLLTAVHLLVGSRFHTPPNTVARAIALADPVVTSGGGMLRFEGFSSCCSTY